MTVTPVACPRRGKVLRRFGVPETLAFFSELRLATRESRPGPGLHLCGEIRDGDRRIGGYHFQWAWASGFIAGQSVDPSAS